MKMRASVVTFLVISIIFFISLAKALPTPDHEEPKER